MVNNDFKLNLFFEMYKDGAVISSGDFVQKFRKKHGKFECMRELIFMIEEYQREKYGNLIDYYAMPNFTKKGKKK